MAEDSIRRVFIGVDLDADVRHGLAAHLAAYAGSTGLPGRPAPPANWHLTLRFLGTLQEVRYEAVLAGLDQAALGSTFSLAFEALGAFPRSSRASVLWLGTGGGSGALTELAATVEAVVTDAGVLPEDRPFHPHLTLSRIRPPEDVRSLIERVPPFPVPQVVRRLTVFRSDLGGGPARYEALETFDLPGAGSSSLRP